MSARIPKSHRYTGAHHPTKPVQQTHTASTFTSTLPLPPSKPDHDLLHNPQVIERFRNNCISNLEAYSKRQGVPVPHLMGLATELEGKELAELTMVLDLLGHFIDTETKYATNVLKLEDFLTANRQVRRRLREQKAKEKK